MVMLKRRNQGASFERRVRPRIEPEPDIDEVETESDATHSSDESEGDDSGEGLGFDGESSENVRNPVSQFPSWMVIRANIVIVGVRGILRRGWAGNRHNSGFLRSTSKSTGVAP